MRRASTENPAVLRRASCSGVRRNSIYSNALRRAADDIGGDGGDVGDAASAAPSRRASKIDAEALAAVLNALPAHTDAPPSDDDDDDEKGSAAAEEATPASDAAASASATSDPLANAVDALADVAADPLANAVDALAPDAAPTPAAGGTSRTAARGDAAR